MSFHLFSCPFGFAQSLEFFFIIFDIFNHPIPALFLCHFKMKSSIVMFASWLLLHVQKLLILFIDFF